MLLTHLGYIQFIQSLFSSTKAERHCYLHLFLALTQLPGSTLTSPTMACFTLFSCFPRKPTRTTHQTASSGSISGDPAISAPWGFKHHNIDEAFQRIPPELEEEFRRALTAKGLNIPEKRAGSDIL